MTYEGVVALAMSYMNQNIQNASSTSTEIFSELDKDNTFVVKEVLYDTVALAMSYINQNIKNASSTSTEIFSELDKDNMFVVKEVLYDTDKDGHQVAVHVRLDRFYKGLRVIGGDSIVHINATDQSLSGISQTLLEPLKIDTEDVVTANVQVSRGMETFANIGELVVYGRTSMGYNGTLAWDVMMSGIAEDGTYMTVHVIHDAETGEVLDQFSDTKTYRPTGWPGKPLSNVTYGKPQMNTPLIVLPTVTPASGIGNTLFLGMIDNLATGYDGTKYYLLDPTRNYMYTTDATGLTYEDADEGPLFMSDDNEWGDGTIAATDTVAADADYAAQVSFDYFLQVFGRRGVFNNQDGIYSRVHVEVPGGAGWCNSAYDPESPHILYGDAGTCPDGEYWPQTALDIGAHEYTHAVADAIVGWNYSGETAALDEATSDIFGAMIEFFAQDVPFYSPNYIFDFQTYKNPGKFDRSMIQPSDDGNSFDCYCDPLPTGADVEEPWYCTMGIANHFFYLLAEGTTNGVPSKTCNPEDCENRNVTEKVTATGTETLEGIGKEKAAAIWFRALSRYFTTDINYSGAREATVKAAKDLYKKGSEAEAVKNAWDAVLVISGKAGSKTKKNTRK